MISPLTLSLAVLLGVPSLLVYVSRVFCTWMLDPPSLRTKMQGWQKLCQDTWKEFIKRCSSDDQSRDPDEENSIKGENIPLRERSVQENAEAI